MLRRQKLELGISFMVPLYLMWAVCEKRIMADEWKKSHNSSAPACHAKQSCCTTSLGMGGTPDMSDCSPSSNPPLLTVIAPLLLTCFLQWHKMLAPVLETVEVLFTSPESTTSFCRYIFFHSQPSCPHLLLTTEWAECLFWAWKQLACSLLFSSGI